MLEFESFEVHFKSRGHFIAVVEASLKEAYVGGYYCNLFEVSSFPTLVFISREEMASWVVQHHHPTTLFWEEIKRQHTEHSLRALSCRSYGLYLLSY